MELNEYQEKAMSTCTASSENFAYTMLNLVGEVGELASKVAKAIRKEELAIKDNRIVLIKKTPETSQLLRDMKLECGDVAWMLAVLCATMGWKLDSVCQDSLEKLASRKERGVIVGSGDNR